MNEPEVDDDRLLRDALVFARDFTPRFRPVVLAPDDVDFRDLAIAGNLPLTDRLSVETDYLGIGNDDSFDSRCQKRDSDKE